MKILIGCEFSGTVREAFKNVGCDAWSCDLLPTEIPGQHLQCNILDILNDNWDLAIFHPDCQYLAVSGARWLYNEDGSINQDRLNKQNEALEFVKTLLNAPIPRICLENPVSIISTRIRKCDQIIQPWQYGHFESKRTCLWLKGLPKLVPTNILNKPACGYWSNQTPSKQNKLAPSEHRWKDRARTYAGIAKAFADQWGKL